MDDDMDMGQTAMDPMDYIGQGMIPFPMNDVSERVIRAQVPRVGAEQDGPVVVVTARSEGMNTTVTVEVEGAINGERELDNVMDILKTFA
jgi:hypothetical protein